MGGHDVPEADVRRRYYRSVRNFYSVYRAIVSSWRVYSAPDASTGLLPPLIATGSGGAMEKILQPRQWERLRTRAGAANNHEEPHG
jgi:predicted ABC-type ATPase